MIATLDPHGHIILPPEIAEMAQAGSGRRFDVALSTSGVILLRPERRPNRTLVESFAALRGLEIAHREDPIPQPPVL